MKAPKGGKTIDEMSPEEIEYVGKKLAEAVAKDRKTAAGRKRLVRAFGPHAAKG